MNKEESLAFLQNCIEKVKRATAQDIQFYKEVYDRECDPENEHLKRRNFTIYEWEMNKIKNWTTEEIKNRIWMAVSCGQPVPGQVSVEALRMELVCRGEEPVGYHNT